MSTSMDTNTVPSQMQAYVAWVNAQMRKKAGTRQIEDLCVDMQDGVALIDLIHIVAGERLHGVHPTPSCTAEMLVNVEQVLHFMMAKRIKMHQTPAQDIVSGNLKSIMRLILALAAHFKPSSVRQAVPAGKPVYHQTREQHSVAGLAQGAAAALATARRDMASMGHRSRRPRRILLNEKKPSSGGSPCLLGTQAEESEPSSCVHSRLDTAGPSGQGSIQRCLNFALPHTPPSSDTGGVSEVSRVECSSDSGHMEALQAEHDSLGEQLTQTKNSLAELQKLLLTGCVVDPPAEAGTGMGGERDLVIIRSQLQQAELAQVELREQLAAYKHDCCQLHGVKEGLQKRLAEEHHSFLVMKAELLKTGFSQQSLQNAKLDMEQKLEDKDRLILDLRRDLARQHREIAELKVHYDMREKERENATKSLRVQIQDLQERLRRVGETEATLSARVTSQDRKMARLEGKILYSHTETSSRPSSAKSTHSTGSDDLQLVRESLRSLRSLPTADTQLHAIDTLEQSISSLVERLHVTEQSISDNSSKRLNYDSTGDTRRSPISALHGFPVQRLDETNNLQNFTKVLYFTDRTVTPFMCTIPKGLGEICLRDIRYLLDRNGRYRYHFKTMDPEFGTVKEEITHDDDIIPGWEGKIVAWIEEDHG